MASDTLYLPPTLHTINFAIKKPDIARKTSTYLRLLGLYLKQNVNYVAEAKAYFHEEDNDGLREHVHALKGASGNMGMMPLYENAVYVEQKLREGQTVSETEFNQFIQLVEYSLSDASEIIAENNNPSESSAQPVVKGRPYLDVKTEVMGHLEKFAAVDSALVTEFKVAAIGHLDEAAIERVVSYLESFDYDEALAIIR